MRHWFAVSTYVILTAGLLCGLAQPPAAQALGFGARSTFVTGDEPDSIAAGDFNGDGKKDLVTANYRGDSVSVLLGNGRGGFATKSDFLTAHCPVGVAIADLNGDGNKDLATANRAVNSVSVLLGNGSGGFGAKTDFATGQQPEVDRRRRLRRRRQAPTW